MLPCFLYLSSYALVWMCVARHIHGRSKSSMVLGLKCFLQSNWYDVKFDWCSRVTTCIDFGCICGLTPAEISKSNWVSQWAEFKWEGKPRFWINISRHTHVDAILVQPCLGKYHGEIKFYFPAGVNPHMQPISIQALTLRFINQTWHHVSLTEEDILTQTPCLI